MKKGIFFVVTIIFLLYWRLWLPEPKVATDFFFWYTESVKSLFSEPSLWREVLVSDGFGQYIAYSLSIWPVLSFYGVLADIDFSILTRIIGIIPIIFLGSFGIYRLLFYFDIKGWGRSVGTLFYLSNTYILLLLDGGQLYLSLAYAVLPFVFLFYRQAVESGILKTKLLFILSILAISVFDIRILYFVAILIFLSFIFDAIFSSKQVVSNLISHLSLGIFTGMVLVLIHLPWILPSILVKSPSLPMTYDRPQQVEFLSFSSLGHTLLLLQPNWFLNTFGKVTSLKPEFFLIPILVFLAPLLQSKNKKVLFWVCIALISIFLTKGSQDPFGNAYIWLFNNVPGFVLFRDPSKFYFLTALSFSVLLAFSIDGVTKLKTKSSSVRWIIKPIPILVVIYLIILVRPVYLGQMTGLFSSPLCKEDYAKLAKFLTADKQFSRVLYVPHHPPLGYSAPTHPAIDGLYLTGKRPFAVGSVGTYEAVNFLREAPFMGQILDVAGISNIVFPPLDPRRDDMHPDNVQHYYKFINQISALSWVEGQNTSLKIPVLKVKEYQNKFFLASNLWWVVGSDDLYNESTKSANLKLSNNALVFAEESAGFGKRLDEFPEAKIVLNNKNLDDLAATFINPEKLIFPAKKLSFSPDKNGWWKREAIDLMWWRNFLQIKYGIDNTDFDLGGGWAIAEGDLKLKIQSEKFNKGSLLFARVMESSRGGEVRFYQKDTLIGKVGTHSLGNDMSGTNVRWLEVGQLLNSNGLTIESIGDINVVNALAVLESAEWKEYKNKAEKLREEKRIVNFGNENVEVNEARLEYQKINSTKYKVKISQLDKPVFLVFSQSYDAFWKLSDLQPLPVYSLFNVYRIDKDGEYEIYFEAQKYVYPGFIIAIVTLLGIAGLLIFSFRQKRL